MSTYAFIIIRLSSSRLPQKGIMPILDKPMLELMIERVKMAKKIDNIAIVTSSLDSDAPLEVLAEKLGIGCYRGPLENVMERIDGAATHFNCNTVVELLGDNPLVDPGLIDEVVRFFRQGRYDYAATLTTEYPGPLSLRDCFAVGIRVQVYSSNAVSRYREYPEYIQNDGKHPCAYIFDHPKDFKTGYVKANGDWRFLNRPYLNFAVNYKKNFDLIRTVFEKLYKEGKIFSLQDVLDLLDRQRHLYLHMGAE